MIEEILPLAIWDAKFVVIYFWLHLYLYYL
jgi:hypothetical protein